MTIAIFIMLGIYAAMIVIYPLITILHELGHAFAYLLLTKPERIDIFIGSYGDTDTPITFNIKKLHFFVKLKFPYIRTGGLCQSYKSEPDYIKRIIIILAGPVFTFLVALILAAIAFNTEVHGAVKMFCFILILLSFISLVSNLSPNTIAGTDIDSDGKQLAFVLRTRKVYTSYINGLEHFGNNELPDCIAELLKVHACAPANVKVSRCLYTSYMLLEDYPNTEKYLYRLKELNALKTDDYLNRAYLFSRTDRYELAVTDYRRVLRRDKTNVYALNNLGYHLSMNGEYNEAAPLLEKAIAVNPQFAFAHNNLGYVKIMTGWVNQGKELVEKSLELDNENAYAYKNLGIYYLKAKNKELALLNFNKAIELDEHISMGLLMNEARSL